MRYARTLIGREIHRSLLDDGLVEGVRYREGLFAASCILTNHLETL